QHRIHVARSLAEARRYAEALLPDVVVLDYDPPLRGTISFFQELQHTLPKTRALVIAAGSFREIVAERRSQGALQFLEKPFDLTEFGAAIEALIGGWAGTGSACDTLHN